MRTIASILIAASLSGCAPAQPRSVQYFEAHLDEAREVVADCKTGARTGEECANAAMAAEVADGRERFKRFRGE